MKIHLVEKNQKGKEALEAMLDLKKKASLPFKLLLSRVKFNATKLKDDPLTIEFKHMTLDKLPYQEIQADMIKSAIGAIFKYLDASVEDIEIIIDDTEVIE